MPLALFRSYWNEASAVIRAPAQAAAARSSGGVSPYELLFVLLVLVIMGEMAARLVIDKELLGIFREILPVRRGYSSEANISPQSWFLLTGTWIVILYYSGPYIAEFLASKFGGHARDGAGIIWVLFYLIILLPMHVIHMIFAMSIDVISHVLEFDRLYISVFVGVGLKILIMYFQAVMTKAVFLVPSLRQGFVIVFVWEIAVSVLLAVRGAAILQMDGARP